LWNLERTTIFDVQVVEEKTFQEIVESGTSAAPPLRPIDPLPVTGEENDYNVYTKIPGIFKTIDEDIESKFNAGLF
jgi:hypothetical protein